jgi:VWFA-related protein
VERDANPRRLRQLAAVSGGEAFLPRSIADVDGVLRRIARDIRNSYTIGYVPSNTAVDRRLRTIRVVAKGRDGHELRVRTRRGYSAMEF